MLTIHPDAKASFDSKGSELLGFVEQADDKQQAQKFSPDVHIKHLFTEKDIINFRLGTVTNGFGEEPVSSSYMIRRNTEYLMKIIRVYSSLPNLSSKRRLFVRRLVLRLSKV